MNGWKLVNPFELKECELSEKINAESVSKVKLTKALLTLPDVLRFNGEIETENVVLGSFGIGIISEAGANLFELEKGKRVFVEPTRPCGECYNCINHEPSKCSNLLMAGEDFDGFLRDFISADSGNIYLLPDSISGIDALFIGHVSLALSIIDKLDIKKGEYVAIVGSDNFAIILAQLLIYYQAVPIIIGDDKEELKIAKDSNIYYVLNTEENYQKEIVNITGGRYADKAVYVSDSDIPVSKVFSVVSFNASVAFTGTSNKNITASFSQAVKKQLNICFVNTGYGNTASSINIITNKAIDFSHLKLDYTEYKNIPETLQNMSDKLESDGKIHETVVKLSDF